MQQISVPHMQQYQQMYYLTLRSRMLLMTLHIRMAFIPLKSNQPKKKQNGRPRALKPTELVGRK